MDRKLDFKAVFEQDGSLRDIYILNTTVDDWQRLLDFLHFYAYPTEFYIERDKQIKLTTRSCDLFDDEMQISRLIKIRLGKLTLHSHCFTKSEIEFDLDPREVNDEEIAHEVWEFMKNLGEYMNRPVRLTPENDSQLVLIEYRTNKNFWAIGENIKDGDI